MNSTTDVRFLIDSELEAVVLGTILCGGDRAYREVAGKISRTDFGVEKHRQIFAAIERTADEVGVGVDSVGHDLIERGKLDAVGGLSALVDVDARGIPGASLTGFVASLRTKAKRRRQLALIQSISGAVESGLDPNCAEIDELRTLSDGMYNRAGAILTIEDLPDLGESFVPMEYLIEPELPAGAVVAFTGDSGSGKSTLLTALGREVIRRGHPVLVLDRENPRAVLRDRLDRLGVQDGPLLRVWHGGLSYEAPDPSAAVVCSWVKSCDRKPLVIVDSVVAFHGGDENAAADTRRFMHGPRRLANLGASVALIHHDGKSETARDYRGSSDFKASLDQAFHVTNVSTDSRLDRLKLRCFKSRYGFSGELVYRYADGKMVRDERASAPERTVADQLTTLLRQTPGVTGGAFESKALALGITRTRVRDFLGEGVLAGLIRRETGSQNAKKYTLEGTNE